MFTARRFTTTTMAGVVYQVVGFDGKSIFTTQSIFTTRSLEVAVRVAARCNSGDMRVFATDFSGT